MFKCLLSVVLAVGLMPTTGWAVSVDEGGAPGPDATLAADVAVGAVGAQDSTTSQNVSDAEDIGATSNVTDETEENAVVDGAGQTSDGAGQTSNGAGQTSDGAGQTSDETAADIVYVEMVFPACAQVQDGVVSLAGFSAEDMLTFAWSSELLEPGGDQDAASSVTPKAELVVRAAGGDQTIPLIWTPVGDSVGLWAAEVPVGTLAELFPEGGLSLEIVWVDADQITHALSILPADSAQVTVAAVSADGSLQPVEATSFTMEALTPADVSADIDAGGAAEAQSRSLSVNLDIPTNDDGTPAGNEVDGVRYLPGTWMTLGAIVTGDDITSKTVTLNGEEVNNVAWTWIDGLDGWYAQLYFSDPYVQPYQQIVIGVQAEDAEGRQASATSVPFVLDVSDPDVSFSYEKLTDAATISIEDAYLDLGHTTVTLDGKEVNIPEDGWMVIQSANDVKIWRTTVTLPRDLAEHRVTVSTRDYSGRTTDAEQTYNQADRERWMADTTAPVVSIQVMGQYLATANGVDYYRFSDWGDEKTEMGPDAFVVTVDEENLASVTVSRNIDGYVYNRTYSGVYAESHRIFVSPAFSAVDGRSIKYVVTATDKAGNATTYAYGETAANGSRTIDAQGQVRSGEKVILVDDAGFPQVSALSFGVVSSGGASDSLSVNERDGVDYFDGPVRLSLSVEKAALLDLDRSTLNMPGATYTLSSLIALLKENESKRSALFALNVPSEGTYAFSLTLRDVFGEEKTISYQDIVDAGTTFDGRTLSGGAFVIDQTAPVVSLAFDRNDPLNGRYYNQTRTATVTVQEQNFYPDLAYVSAGRVSSWEKDGEGCYRATVTFDEDGDYALTTSCADAAGHQSNVCASETFTVDKTAPVIDVSYDQTSANSFYAADRTATVTVTDMSFNESLMQVSTTGQTSGWYDLGAGRHGMTVVFSEGQNHTLTVTGSDLAGNAAAGYQSETFTVDTTNPVIQVSFDNNAVANGKYYKAARTATVTVTDENFDSSLFQVTTSGSIGAWSSGGNQHVLDVSFGADGTYDLAISGNDLAGNPATPYTADSFVVDTKTPTLEVRQIEDGGVYTGQVAPVLTFADEANFDSQSVTWRLTGAKNGDVGSSFAVTASPTASGTTLTFADFDSTPLRDDAYTLTAQVSDLAGNSVEKTLSFCVDRYGSTYQVLASDGWAAVASDDQSGYFDLQWTGSVAQEKAPTVTIRETNVAGITPGTQTVTITRDGEPLTEGSVTAHRSEENGWTVYDYVVPATMLMEQTGVYKIYVTSTDAAGNTRSNALFYGQDGSETSAVARFELSWAGDDQVDRSTATAETGLLPFAVGAGVVALLAILGIALYFRKKDQAIDEILGLDGRQE